MELKNYSIEATGSLYCSENFATICVDGQTYGIEKLIYEMMKSLKKEVREYTRLYEAYSLPHDEVIMRVCNQYADSYKEAIREEMEVVLSLIHI